MNPNRIRIENPCRDPERALSTTGAQARDAIVALSWHVTSNLATQIVEAEDQRRSRDRLTVI